MKNTNKPTTNPIKNKREKKHNKPSVISGKHRKKVIGKEAQRME
jgi:hypothetical protein